MSEIVIETRNGPISVNLETVTLEEACRIISTLPIDAGVPDDAVTVLYSAKINGVSANEMAINLNGVRILDNTGAGKFLADKSKNCLVNQLIDSAIKNDMVNETFDISRVKEGLEASELAILSKKIENFNTLDIENQNAAIKLARQGFLYEPTQGAWAIISKAFIEATPPNSVIVCLTAEAPPLRTWALLEVPTALDVLSDDHMFGGYTIAQLKEIRGRDGPEAVQVILKQKSFELSSDILFYYDAEGKMHGDASALVGSTPKVPEGTVFSATYGELLEMPSDTQVISLYPSAQSLDPMNLLKLRKFVYELDKLPPELSSTMKGNALSVLSSSGPKGVSWSEFYDFYNVYKQLDPKVQANATLWNKLYDNFRFLSDEGNTQVIAPGSAVLSDLTTAAKNLKIYGSIQSGISKVALPLAATLLVVDAVDKFMKAGESFAAGNYDKGWECIRQWGCDTGGVAICSMGTGLLIDAVLGTTLLALAATGPIGIAVALVVSVGIPLITTILFSDEVSNFLHEAGDWLAGAASDLGDWFTNLIGSNKGEGAGGVFDGNVVHGSGGIDYIYGNSGSDSLYGSEKSDRLYGGSGDDYLNGKGGADALYGGDGNDRLYGGNGDDILDGGVGNDSLYGEAGNDVYLFGKGSGQDIIYDSQGLNRIKFGEGITPADLALEDYYPKDDLIISILGTDDKLILQNFRTNAESRNFELEFADGTVFAPGAADGPFRNMFGSDSGNIITSAFDGTVTHGRGGSDTLYGNNGADTLYGDEGDDYLNGSGGADALYGGDGSDRLYGGNGDDILDGGAGNDSLWGEAGNDVYLFGKGSGQDIIYDSQGVNRIKFGEGITPADLTFSDYSYRQDQGLIISILGTNDKLTISNFRNSAECRNFELEFADGTVFAPGAADGPFRNMFGSDSSEIMTAAFDGTVIHGRGGIDNLYGSGSTDELYGDDGDDIVSGNGGADALYGGNGNDSLYGGEGDDVLLGENGNDTLYGENGNDILDGGAGNDTLQGGVGNDVYLFYMGSGQDTIYDSQGLNRIKFGEGITPAHLAFSDYSYYQDRGFTISILGTNDKLTIPNFKNSAEYRNFELEFADGTVFAPDAADGPFRNMFGSDNVDGITAVLDHTTIHGQGGNDSIYGSNSADTLYGDDGDDYLGGNGGADTLYGGAGNDNLNGGDGDDVLYGGDGNDTLNGDSGDDILDGGAGNDNLWGGAGNDVYLFGKGSGQDTIYDSQGLNRIKFGEGITPADLAFADFSEYPNTGIAISILGTTDKLKLPNFKDRAEYRNFELEFADGTVFAVGAADGPFRNMFGSDNADGMTAVFDGSIVHSLGGNDNITGSGGDDELYGDEGNDTINGNGGADKLYGGTGNDALYGGEGDDILDGGAGNDSLYGEAGNDVYLFGRGSGQDTIYDSQGLNRIKFGEGITPADLAFADYSEYPNTGVAISILGTTDKLKLPNFKDRAEYRNFELEFADGTVFAPGAADGPFRNMFGSDNADGMTAVFDGTVIHGQGGNDSIYGSNSADTLYGDEGDDYLGGNGGADKLYGGSGNDRLYGGEGDDILDGGAGNDSLYGEAGNDVYLFGKGSGQDTIYDSQGLNCIKFGEGITPADLAFSDYSSNDFVLSLLGTNDKLTISNFRFSENYRNFELEFADGTVFAPDAADGPFRNMLGSSNGDNMTAVFDGSIVHSLGGNDNITGSGGDDELYGGDGSDNISGNSGADKLYGGSGNDGLYGGDGDDILDGGTENDNLQGGAGNDTYVFAPGSGSDFISDGSGRNIMKFTGGIKPEDLAVAPVGSYDIKITNTLTGDSVNISLFRIYEEYRNFTLVFDDGRTAAISSNGNELLYEALPEKAELAENGTAAGMIAEGADILSGLYSGDTLFGSQGAADCSMEAYAQMQNLVEAMSSFGGEANVFTPDVLNGGASPSLADTFAATA